MKTLAAHQPVIVSEDAILASQLTEAFLLANNAMAHIVRFGAMMWMLEHKLSARGQFTKGGRGKKGGVSEWLRINAPEINKQKAFRFLYVAMAVAGKFELAGKVSFAELATRPADELPPALAKKQLELWDFVNGTSQRSWLDQFSPGLRGGATEGGRSKKTPEEQLAEEIEAARQLTREAISGFAIFAEDGRYKYLNDAELDNLVLAAEEALGLLKTWQATPKRDRDAQALAPLRR